ncbi:HD domain-containing phosphohydrolase [Vibrio mediterranei]
MSKKNKTSSKLSIRRVVALLFTLAITATALISATVIYSLTKEREVNHALANYQLISSLVSQRLEQIDQVGEQSAVQLGYLLSTQLSEKSPSELIELFGATFLGNPFIHSIYIGFDNDDFLQLINLKPKYISDKLNLLEGESWMVIEHSNDIDGKRVKRTRFYFDNFELSREQEEVSIFYPTQRGWYTRASEEEVYKTTPYLFHNLRVTGQTFSRKIPSLNAVIGVDIALASLNEHFEDSLSDNVALEGADAYITDGEGRIIGTNTILDTANSLPFIDKMPLTNTQLDLVINSPVLKVSNQLDWEPIDFTVVGNPDGLAIDLFTLISDATGLQFEYINGRSWQELVNDFRLGKIDILQSIASDSNVSDHSIESDILYSLEYAIATHKSAPHIASWDDLKGRTVGFLGGWSIVEQLRKDYPSITVYAYDTYDEAFEDVQTQKIVGIVDVAPVIKSKVEKLINYDLKTQSLKKHPAFPTDFVFIANEQLKPYIELINQALTYLDQEKVRTVLADKWLNSDQHHTSHIPSNRLLSMLEDPSFHEKISSVDMKGQKHFVYITEVNDTPQEYFVLTIPEKKLLGSAYQYIINSSLWTLAALVIMIPLVWRISTPMSSPIKKLLLQTKRIKHRQYNKVKAFNSSVREVNELSHAIYDMSQSLDAFQRSQDAFIEAIIQLIARAVDEKSPYTGAHCLRVPELAFLLSDAAEQSNDGIFESFEFENEAKRREFRIAAWLHDCGKITTPEYVVDKGTKLETNYNRIHEVRTRFEVLWRDAEITALNIQLEQPNLATDAKQNLKQRQEELLEQFSFIAQLNVGNEFINEQDKVRIVEIGKQTWTSHFDRYLGLSPLEEQRLSAETRSPACEPLLSDRPEHIITRSAGYELDEKLGINMNVPEHLYNLGEIYNLSISRGTLTQEERFKINEHMIAGIKMLSSIPFPEDLKNVERIATTHHETMRGDGYPRRLTGDKLSIPERILAVADIFEALTAADRPYKKAKTISESLDILHKMALEEHVDMEVFQLFIKSRVYMTYSKRFLAPTQIDEVDESKYLS